MEVNGIGSQSFYEKITGQKSNKKDSGNEFYKSLSDTMDGKTETESEEGKYNFPQNTDIRSWVHYYNISPKAVHTIEPESENTVVECSVRKITYTESDNVKVSIANGYVYKAQVNADNSTVYVEQKSEEGTVKGYEVELSKVKEDTNNPIEQMALETWNKAGESSKSTNNIDSKWDEALLQFYNFVEDRVKNGAPKFQVGGSELSIDEWNHLLEKIDGNLDDIKNQMAERIKKIKESQDNNKTDEISEKVILELLRNRTGNDIAESDIAESDIAESDTAESDTEKAESVTKSETDF